MEELNKTQVVLLCLLVSFVTSIGTGVITFSLLDKAPEQVTQTINRVVERTIETVTPAAVIEGTNENSVQEVTVVVKEEDLIIDAIQKASKSIVRIRSGKDKNFYSLGLVVSKEGLVIADRKNVGAAASYTGELQGKTYQLVIVNAQSNSETIFFEIRKETNDTTVFTPAALGNSDNAALGQTVIAVSGFDRNMIATGRVTGVEQKDEEGKMIRTAIETDITQRDLATGGPLLNLSGEVIGLNIPKNPVQMNNSFTPINLIKTEIQSVQTQ